MIGAFRLLADQLAAGHTPLIYPVFDANQGYTAIFDAAGDKIADLGSDLATRIVTLYIEVKGAMDTLNNYARFPLFQVLGQDESGAARQKIIHGLRIFADALETILATATAVADDLRVASGVDT